MWSPHPSRQMCQCQPSHFPTPYGNIWVGINKAKCLLGQTKFVKPVSTKDFGLRGGSSSDWKKPKANNTRDCTNRQIEEAV